MSRRGDKSGGGGKSGGGRDRKDRGKGGSGGDYEVGYGRPPPQFQFPPKVSGNPNGRPKGATGKHKKLRACDQPTREFLIEEGQRMITITEGGKRIKILAQQAVVRATYLSALKGSPHAQRTLLQELKEIEAHASDLQDELIDTVESYKTRTTPEFLEQRGLSRDELVPHPDDIVVDRASRTVELNGPMFPENKAALDQLLEKRDAYASGVAGHLGEADENPEDETLIPLAYMAQQHVDYINDRLPERYRKPLERRVTDDEYRRAMKIFNAKQRKKESRRRKRRKPRGQPADNGSQS
jgi:hypothetical protein